MFVITLCLMPGFLDWASGEPADVSPAEACVRITEAGKWATADCDTLLRPVCKAPYAISRLGRFLLLHTICKWNSVEDERLKKISLAMSAVIASHL